MIALLALTSCQTGSPTAEEARKFVDEAEPRLLALANEAGRAAWVQANFITQDTEALAAKANERAIAAQVEYAKQAALFDNVKLPDDVRRKLTLLKLSLTLPAPSDPKEAAETADAIRCVEAGHAQGKIVITT